MSMVKVKQKSTSTNDFGSEKGVKPTFGGFEYKNEYEGIKKLLRVKIKTMTNKFNWFFIVAAIMFITSLASTVLSIFFNNSQDVLDYKITDYSTVYFILMIFSYLAIMLEYGRINNRLSVFPQTNTGRFITTQLFEYLMTVLIGLTAVASYLLYYGIIKLLSIFKENVYLVLNFNLKFIMIGFLTFLSYSFLIIAMFGLIGAVIRKWRFYAVIALIMIVSLMFVYMSVIIEADILKISFLTKEPSPALFILKAGLLWIVITMISILINYNTKYYKSMNTITKKVAVCALIIATVMIVTVVIALNLMISSINMKANKNIVQGQLQQEMNTINDYLADFDELRIDISHLQAGSKIKIQSNHVRFPELDNSPVVNVSGIIGSANGFGIGALESLQGNTLIIKYRLSDYWVNGYDIYKYSNQKLDVYLEGDTLYMNYTYEEAHAVLLPIWSLARQFECFEDSGVLQDVMFGTKISMNGGTQLYIIVE